MARLLSQERDWHTKCLQQKYGVEKQHHCGSERRRSIPFQHVGNQSIGLGRYGDNWTDAVHVHQQFQIHADVISPGAQLPAYSS